MAMKASVTHSLAEWWKSFYSQWSACTQCPLHKCRNSIVLFRGRIPNDILLIGEAPGASEDQFGYPFVGESGKYLDGLLLESDLYPDSLCFTNTVCCIPLDENSDLRDPSAAEIKACNLRLRQFHKACNPVLVIYVGNIAAAASKDIAGWSIRVKHPSWILQLPSNKRNVERARFILTVKTAIQEMRADATH
jgi:uracil-DNA glycosylase family 4